MPSLSTRGCLKHLLIAFGLLIGVVAFAFIREWDTVSLMLDNMTAMGEGGTVAQDIRYPEDLVDYIAEHPESVSLVAFDVGAPDEGIYVQADRPRALTSVPRLMLLAEYARRVERDRWDPEVRVPLDSIAAFALPGAGARQHRRAVAALDEAGRIGADSSITLASVARAAIRHNDDAAADWLIDRMGRRAVETIPEWAGLVDSDPPLPSSGVYLSWSHHADTTATDARLERYRTTPDSVYADRVHALARRLRHDAVFRQREEERRTQRGSQLGLRQQRRFAQATHPRGDAAEYARLMARVATDSSGAFRRMRSFVERPITSDSVEVSITAVGSKGGATPGIISFVGYAQRREAPPRVMALFMDDVPIGVFYHLLQTGLDKGFQLRLLGDDAFFEDVRRRLHEARRAAISIR
jgi:hypothetical protein